MQASRSRPGAVLFDRDGTLIHDDPGCSADLSLVRPVDGAAAAVRAVAERGIPVGVVTNQAAIGRGSATNTQVESVNALVDHLVGPFHTWQVCPHTPEDACGCRKPQPGLVTRAAGVLDVDPTTVVVIGDIESDMLAARAAGARGILVPTDRTLADEVRRAPEVAPDLAAAVALALGDT
jgi:histidinol-phosphate phosphatase family protein